jgi:DNA-binding response OmpR family regulator
MTDSDRLTVDVLVVAADLELRSTIVEFLDDVGYAVAWAADLTEAFDLLEGPLEPRLVVADPDMPVMAASIALEQRMGRAPGAVPVLLLSDAPPRGPLRGPVAGWLEKPVEMRELVEQVGALVRRPAIAA